MRTLQNQVKKDDRFLHAAALHAWKALPLRAQSSPASALGLVVGLTSRNGSADFDCLQKWKALEQVLLHADDETLRKIVRHVHSLIIRPETTEEPVAEHRRQNLADLLLTLVKQYKRYDDLLSDNLEKDDWLRSTLDTFVEIAYFIPSKSAKTRKVPLPVISEASRKMFQERLSSCLTRLLSLGSHSGASFGVMVVGMIRNKGSSSKALEPLLKAEDTVMGAVEKAFQALDSLSGKVCLTRTLSGKLLRSGF